jgi:glutaredoxin
MNETFYPKIEEKNLKLITKLYENDKEYFNKPECPYSSDTKAIFQKTAKHFDFETHELSDEVPETESLVRQMNKFARELEDYGESIRNSDSASSSDKNTYHRLKATLLEKFVDMREKLSKVTEYELFQSEILDIMDKTCTPDQRMAIMERLQQFTGKKSEV